MKWVLENYIESESECLFLLSEYEKTSAYTINEYIDALKELRKLGTSKDSIATHLRILRELSYIGIDARIAGKKIREAIVCTKSC